MEIIDDEEFYKIVESIDSLISKTYKPIFQRPDFIADYILNNLIIDTSNLDLEDKNDRLKLFYLLRVSVSNWYEKKYGKLNIENPDTKDKAGFIIINGNPYKVLIPMVISRPSRRKHERWIIFPDTVYRNEMIIEYIYDCKIIDTFDDRKKSAIIRKLKKIVVYLRKIYKSLITCSVQKSKKKQITDIWRHLNLAITNILEDYHDGVSIAIWELFFAVELAVKLLYYDKYNSVVRIHDLTKIIGMFDDELKVLLLGHDFFSSFPNKDSCIKYRYSELIEYDLGKIHMYYMLTLDFLNITLSKLSHNINFKNGRILLKDPEIVFSLNSTKKKKRPTTAST